MIRRKPKAIPDALAQRVRKVAETPSFVPGPAVPTIGNRELRAPAFRPGTLTFMGGERIEVVVKNISATGARVEFVRNTRLPERVLLTEPLMGVNKWAYVTWETWGVAGLKFVER
jgi:hypothetical protein